MKNFKIRGVFDKFPNFSNSVAQPSRPQQEVQETLRAENFQVKRTFRHGFPFQPTSMAFDPVQRLLAIGCKSGSLRIKNAIRRQMVGTVELIKAVEGYPLLWNLNHSDFSNRYMREKAWHAVAGRLLGPDTWRRMGEVDKRVNVNMLQRRWKNLKDTYQKHSRLKGESKSRKTRPYIHASNLRFLDNIKRLPKNVCKDAEEPEKEPDDRMTEVHFKLEDDDDLREDIEFVNMDMEEERDSEEENTLDSKEDANNSEGNSSNADFEKVKKNLIESYIIRNPAQYNNSTGRKKNEAENDILAEEETDNEDPDKMFLLSMLPLFKKLDDEKRMAARIQLTQVLQKLLYPKK